MVWYNATCKKKQSRGTDMRNDSIIAFRTREQLRLEFTHFLVTLAHHSNTMKKCDILLTVFGRIPIAKKNNQKEMSRHE